MKLESARQLQSELLALLSPAPTLRFDDVPSLVTGMVTAFEANPLDVSPLRATRPAARIAPPHDVSIGLTRRTPSDFVIAVRAQYDTPAARHAMDVIRQRSASEVDERITGPVAKQASWRQSRFRPLLLGCSIGHVAVSAGTLGCFVRMTGDERVFVLSNNHILANENRAAANDAVVQPSVLDGGIHSTDIVARLAEWVELEPAGRNVVDCAVAAVDPQTIVGVNRLSPRGKPIVGPPVTLDIDDKVIKLGRSTKKTEGRVTTIELKDLNVAYDIGTVKFDSVIEIEGAGTKPFSEGGDSGSLIVTADLKPAALLFAGSTRGGRNGRGLTYANPLEKVFAVLELRML